MRPDILPKIAGEARPSVWVVVTLAVVAAGCTEPPPPPPEAMMERDDPAAPFLGAWELKDWRVAEPSGEVTYPYGEDARGQIVYTDEGRMSAHLMRPPDESEASDGDEEEGFQSFHYWGTFTVDLDAETVTHHVLGSRSE
ncbi:MAG: lipocalin-like domain-containing protein, partial [Longimicrobiales bacterium]